MPETLEIWIGTENSCIYYAHQTREIYQVLSNSVDFKIPRSFEIHRVRQFSVNIALFGIKGL